jgi:hypothetical protein
VDFCKEAEKKQGDPSDEEAQKSEEVEKLTWPVNSIAHTNS